jgi:NhaA family Na+:H+ antiporter
MSIFISMLAFPNQDLQRAAKLGVLLGSLVSASLASVGGRPTFDVSEGDYDVL